MQETAIPMAAHYPMTPPRRAKLVLLVLAVAFVGLCLLAWEPVFQWATTTRKYVENRTREIDGETVRGWHYVPRWPDSWGSGGYQGTRMWFLQSAFAAGEVDARGDELRITTWNRDGSVRDQTLIVRGGPNVERHAPPWLWGATNQSVPSAPDWILDDKQWQAALDAQE